MPEEPGIPSPFVVLRVRWSTIKSCCQVEKMETRVALMRRGEREKCHISLRSVTHTYSRLKQGS